MLKALLFPGHGRPNGRIVILKYSAALRVGRGLTGSYIAERFAITRSGTGSCTLTITQSTLLGTRTISAKSETFGAGAPTNPFPIEACLARTPKP